MSSESATLTSADFLNLEIFTMYYSWLRHRIQIIISPDHIQGWVHRPARKCWVGCTDNIRLSALISRLPKKWKKIKKMAHLRDSYQRDDNRPRQRCARTAHDTMIQIVSTL